MKKSACIKINLKKWRKGIVVIALLLFVAALIYERIPRLRAFSEDVYIREGGELKVHFLDVGQADCILIQSGDKNMLIDAGNNEDAAEIIDYLYKQGVERLDYVIATHGHEDHIGGMEDILYQFDIGEFYMPTQMYSTQSYMDVLESAGERGIPIKRPHFKETRELGDADFTFITPDTGADYEDINDSSIGIRLTNGAHSFLLCGDISKDMERAILKSHIYLHADVLKVSHHGSNDTSSYRFLKKVDPEFAVISCGRDNDFGHPHKKTLKNLKKLDIQLFRTDEQGTIIFTSNGRQLICNVNPIWE